MGALLQEETGCVFIEYASKTWSGAQKNYAPNKKEATALLFCD